MKRIFISHILPPSLIQRYKLSTAACNFSFNLMSGGIFDETFSILGTYVNGKLENDAFKDNRFTLFYNTFLRSKGRLGVQLATLIEQWNMFLKIPLGASVWFYNVTTLNAFLYLLLRLFKRTVIVNVIELDFTPEENRFALSQIFLRIINSCHGNIRLSYSPLFTNENYVTLPGVVPNNVGDEPLIEKLNNKFLLSGVLYEHISQLSMVLQAFVNLPQCELHITGKTDNETMIKEYAERFHNIIWHGNLSFREYLDVMHSCTFQLSTRDPKALENQCNFPSKVIETLLHNRIIISTIEYPQIKDVKYFYVNLEQKLFQSYIEDIVKMPDCELIKYANQGKKVAKMFSTKVWNEAMLKIEK